MPSRTWRWRTGRPRPSGRRWTRGLGRGRTIARRVLVGRRRRRALPPEIRQRTATTATWPTGVDVRSVGESAGTAAGVSGAGRPGGPVGGPGAQVRSRDGARETTVWATRRRFLLVSVCTLTSLGLGMGAIFAAEAGQVRLGAVMLLGCVVFDGLDGTLARRLGVVTPFGAQLDSLADMCAFGIATPVVTYLWLSSSGPVGVVAPVCVLFAMCAAIRLARFNVSPASHSHFSGLPTTIAAAIVVVTALARPDAGPNGLTLMVGLVALSMVTTFPYVKAGALRRLPLWLWPVGVVAAVLEPAATLPVLLGGYLFSGPALWAFRRRQPAT